MKRTLPPAFACAIALLAIIPAAPADVVTIQYGTGATRAGEMPLLLNLHRDTAPPGQPARPVLVAIHGGSFRRGSRDDANLAAMARQIVPAGFTVLSISYRLGPDEPVLSEPFAALVDAFEQAQPVLRQRPRAFFEAMLAASEDLATVLRWIAANAAEHGMDPDRVFLLGSSAGAIAALNTVYGLPSRITGDTGVRIAGVVDLWGALPGVDKLPADGPPLLIIHGDKDPTVDVEAARKLVGMAAAAGMPHTAYIMPDRLHGFGGNPPLTTEVAPGTSICAAVLAFLRDPAAASGGPPDGLRRVAYNHPGLTVDLGVGLWGWPVPYDANADGLPDLFVVSGGLAGRGVYFFENTGRTDPACGQAVFRPAVRLGDGRNDVTGSVMPDGSLRVLTPGFEHPDFPRTGLASQRALPVDPLLIHKASGRLRGNQWSHVDFNGDGVLDLVVGMGDWTEYGWEDAHDANGRWVNGPLHGYVFILENTGSNDAPAYAAPVRLEADGRPVDVYGTPSPVFADFRGTGRLDLVCGEFVDGLTFFENTGTREQPRYAAGRRLRHAGQPLLMPLCMIVVSAFDWNNDGRPDLVVAQEDGRVAWLENTGRVVDGQPEFLPPRFFRQEADELKFGVLSTPVSVDWDGDGLPDLLAGNAAGEIAFIRNLGGTPPRWAEPRPLEAGGEVFRIMAGYNGSIQGPAESKWGYTNIGVGDWNGDGLPDILVNSIWGRILLLENIGTRTAPALAKARPVEVDWDGPPPKPAWNWWDPQPAELVVQWRSTPHMIDLDDDGLMDLVTVDPDGYLAWYRQVERDGRRILLPGRRVFSATGPSAFDSRHEAREPGPGLLRMNDGRAGRSGRRTFCFVDWDGDGRTDLLVNSVNINFLRNVAEAPGQWVFRDEGPLDALRLAGHSTAPAIVDWNGDGIPDLLAGAEDGYFYHLLNPRSNPGTGTAP